MQDKTIISLMALGIIGILEAIALLKDINGTALAAVFAILGAAAGIKIPDLYKKLKR